MFFYFMRWALV